MTRQEMEDFKKREEQIRRQWETEKQPLSKKNATWVPPDRTVSGVRFGYWKPKDDYD